MSKALTLLEVVEFSKGTVTEDVDRQRSFLTQFLSSRGKPVMALKLSGVSPEELIRWKRDSPQFAALYQGYLDLINDETAASLRDVVERIADPQQALGAINALQILDVRFDRTARYAKVKAKAEQEARLEADKREREENGYSMEASSTAQVVTIEDPVERFLESSAPTNNTEK